MKKISTVTTIISDLKEFFILPVIAEHPYE